MEPILEICAESFASALVAEAGGADRIELCEQLASDGVTPGTELMRSVIEAVKIPVFILIRPRVGNFIYKKDELEQIKAEVEHSKLAGAAGVTLGVLRPDLTVDIEVTRELVEIARPMPVTFHRAFDRLPDLIQGLEDVISTGAIRLLTSGGAPNVLDGAHTLARLREHAAGRIEIMAGGGLRLGNLMEVRRLTGINCLHSSLLKRPELSPTGLSNGHQYPVKSGEAGATALKLHVDDVREAARLLRLQLQSA